MDASNSRLLKYLPTIIIPAIWVTVKILFFSSLFSISIGLILGTILVLVDEEGLIPNKFIFTVIDKSADILRAFPTLILIVALMPLTRLIVGTTVGVNSAIFSISIAGIPYATRIVESSLRIVDKQLIEAAKSMGASTFQIVFKVMYVVALPNLVSNLTMMIINMLNTTTIAGAVGAGGLGAVALAYGYQRFDDLIMYFIVAILLLMVLLIQRLGRFIYKILK